MKKKAFKQLLKSIDEVPEIRAPNNYEKKAREFYDKVIETDAGKGWKLEQLARFVSEAVEAERKRTQKIIEGMAPHSREEGCYQVDIWDVLDAIRAHGGNKVKR